MIGKIGFHHQNEVGVSLLGVAVSAIVGGVFIAMIIQLMTQLLRNSRGLETQASMSQVMNDISIYYRQEVSCRANFTGRTIATLSSISDVMNASGTSLYQTGSTYLGNVDIRRLGLVNAVNMGPVMITSGKTRYYGEIRVELSSSSQGQAGGAVGANDLVRSIPVSFIVDDSSGEIETCSGGGHINEICTDLGGIPVVSGGINTLPCEFDQFALSNDSADFPATAATTYIKGNVRVLQPDAWALELTQAGDSIWVNDDGSTPKKPEAQSICETGIAGNALDGQSFHCPDFTWSLLSNQILSGIGNVNANSKSCITGKHICGYRLRWENFGTVQVEPKTIATTPLPNTLSAFDNSRICCLGDEI